MPLGLTVANWGTSSISDVLAVNNTSIINFGIQDVAEAVSDLFAKYNANVTEELSLFTTTTTERTFGVGSPASMIAEVSNEFIVRDAQKVSGVNFMGLPLRPYDVNTQWTYYWMEKHSPADLAFQVKGAFSGDTIGVQTALRKAIFQPINTYFMDILRDNMTIPVKAFANADGFPIPAGPNGQQFNPNTHNHYMGCTGTNGALTSTDADNLVGNVTEHYAGGRTLLLVSKDVEAFMGANAVNFPYYVRYGYAGNVQPTTVVSNPQTLAIGNPSNRQTGTYRDAEVWVKPWMPSGTLICMQVNTTKPIGRRIPDDLGAANGDFNIIYENGGVPLQCKMMRREHGFGAMDRIAAAVMTVGNSTYVQPPNLDKAVA